MTLSGYTGYSQVISSIANQTASTAMNYTATDVSVQNLTIKPTGTVNIHTLPSLNGKISLGVMTIEPGGRLVIDKQYCK